MSYEKCTIIATPSRTNTQTGEISNYVEVDIIKRERIKIPDAESLNACRSLVGKTVLMPAEFRNIEGRVFLVMSGDGIPLLAPDAQKPTTVQFPQAKTGT